MRPLPRASVVAAVALLAVAGCTTGVADPSPTPSATTTTSAPPSVSPTPSPTTESERAAASAEALVREYYRVTDAVAKDPTDLEPLESVSTSADLLTLQNELTPWERDRWHQTGDSKIIRLTTQSVSLDNSDPDQGVVPAVQVDVCYDVSTLDVVDESGTSQIEADRPDRAWERLWVANYDYAADPDDGWRVADGKTLEREPCAGS